MKAYSNTTGGIKDRATIEHFNATGEIRLHKEGFANSRLSFFQHVIKSRSNGLFEKIVMVKQKSESI
jgi:hypothetical protein